MATPKTPTPEPEPEAEPVGSEGGDVWDAPNQQTVRPDGSAPWEEGDGGGEEPEPEPEPEPEVEPPPEPEPVEEEA